MTKRKLSPRAKEICREVAESQLEQSGMRPIAINACTGYSARAKKFNARMNKVINRREIAFWQRQVKRYA